MKIKYVIPVAMLMLASCSSTTKESTNDMANDASCPFGFDELKSSGEVIKSEGNTNRDWWPNQLDLSVLRQNSSLSNPMGDDFNYAEQFNKLDYFELKKDIEEVMLDSKDWWPADYGNYGGLLFAWLGIAQEHTELVMEEAVLERVNNDLLLRIVGLIMLIWIKQEGYFGR